MRAAPSFGRAAAWLRAQVEAQADRWTLWAPVAMGLGAGGYFALPKEPLAAVAWAALSFAVLAAVLVRRWAPNRALMAAGVLLAVALAGFAAAKLRTERVRAPIIAASPAMTTIEGWVVDVAGPGRSGARIVIAPVRIDGVGAQATPIRIRVTLREGIDPPGPGAAVRLRAILNPPPPPASPGAYDFARDAFFEGIGGVGFSLTPPRAAWLAPAPWRLEAAMRVNAMRWSLAERIVEQMGEETGGLAAAMVTGHDAFVPRQQVDDMRAAGLAHIISISGLHMAIVGGFAFAAVRLLIAVWPWAALRVSGKKIAALAGLAAVTGYLIVSGAPPPAERAAITAAVAFGAILADRRAISLHALAIAALIILILQPEAVTEPGFQMSFSATAALVALAEAWPRPAREINTPWPFRVVQGVGVWIGASLAASFVAGLATGPFAIQHFNRVSTFGLFANLAVAPISSFLMMPALALGAALTPLGLGEWPLDVAGFGISLMTRNRRPGVRRADVHPARAERAQSRPGRGLSRDPLALPVARPPALGGPALGPGREPGATRPGPGRLGGGGRRGRGGPRRRGGRALSARRQAVRRGVLGPAARPRGRRGWRRGPRAPSRLRPLVVSPDRQRPGARIAALWSRRTPSAETMSALCQQAELVVVRGERPPTGCAQALVLGAADFARGGSVELYRTATGWRMVWAQDLRGRRPWSLAPEPSGSGG